MSEQDDYSEEIFNDYEESSDPSPQPLLGALGEGTDNLLLRETNMALVWDDAGNKKYESGVDHGVLYATTETGTYGTGVPWNGLISVSESPSGAESTKSYADNIAYLNMVSAEEFGATIEAYTYPDEFAVCDGTAEPADGVYVGQQTRRTFGFSYRTKVGDDLKGTDAGYKLHLIYGALAAPSEKAYTSINDSPEAITFSWELTTTPVSAGSGLNPTASITIDSTKVEPTKLETLEAALYGSGEGGSATLPLPEEVISMLS